MASNMHSGRKPFKSIEKDLTKIILVDLILFLLVITISHLGIGWLKIILGIITLALSALGDLFLVLINEHKRPRSRWMLAAFAAIFLCTLVSLLTGSPAPVPSVPKV